MLRPQHLPLTKLGIRVHKAFVSHPSSSADKVLWITSPLPASGWTTGGMCETERREGVMGICDAGKRLS